MGFRDLFQRKKFKIYVSYDHHTDASAYEQFLHYFGSSYHVARDNSVERELGSADRDSFIHRVGETLLPGADCTVVLCGVRTHEDPFVDWEIKASLDAKKGLIAIGLPTNPAQASGGPVLPARMDDNFQGGYSVYVPWRDLASGKADLTKRIWFAKLREPSLIRNDRPLLTLQT